MKMTFKISDTHEIEITHHENGTVTADSMHKVNEGLWSHNFKDFESIEKAITHYQIAF